MFESLPVETQANLHPNKKVVNIEATDAGVTVRCTDGSSYEGTMVIGADGAHSLVRDQMLSLAQKHPELDASFNDDGTASAPLDGPDASQPFCTTYRCLWIGFPTAAAHGLVPGCSFETHGPGATTQVFSSQESTVIGLYERLPAPTRTPQRRYDAADHAAIVARWADLLVVGPDAAAGRGAMTLQQAYEARLQSGCVNLEEGVVKRWGWAGRVVLVGDAAHKFTPSTGAGCNNGMVDVVVLMNQLHALLHKDSTTTTKNGGELPSRDDLAAVFSSYQDARFGPVTAGCEGAGRATATATWETYMMQFLDTWVFPAEMLQRYFMGKAAAFIAKTPVLTYVAAEERLHGKVEWEQPMKATESVAAY
jgi:2-polyprenyl-6-methoxyphenol hydroxylase-like FAD-dependent oxidoreductase